MNPGALLILLLLGLSFCGIPIAVSIGIATMTALWAGGFPLTVITQKLFVGMDNTALLAIPFFILAGNLMIGGINNKLIDFSNSLIGWVRGSLGIVTVASSGLFAAISGSAVATVSAIGGTMIPGMKEEGYKGPFAAAVASSASILGPIIPPSIPLIVYGSIAEVSVSKLFIGSLIPGVGLAILFMIYVLYYAKKNNLQAKPRMKAKEIGQITLDCIWALLMPFIILGGIFLGIFTPTEAAAFIAGYALIIGLFVYKNLKWKDLGRLFWDTAKTTAVIYILIGFSKASSWVIVTSKLPQDIISFFTHFTTSPIVILLCINILLLIVGMLMEGNAAVVMLTPMFLPLLDIYHISAIQFGIIMSFNLCIGLLTPPVGACVLLGNSISGEKFSQTMRATMPFILISLVWLMAVTYIPNISLWLTQFVS